MLPRFFERTIFVLSIPKGIKYHKIAFFFLENKMIYQAYIQGFSGHVVEYITSSAHLGGFDKASRVMRRFITARLIGMQL
jgi:hypothetical protein